MTRVLAVRLDNDGDVLLAGPAIRALAAGADEVTLLCGPRGAQAARMLPGVDEIIVWRAPWIDPEPDPVSGPEVDRLVGTIAALRPDRALIFGSFHQSPLPTALLLRLAGVKWIGATSVDYPGSLLDLRHQIGDDVHEVERSLDLVRAAGFELPPADDGRLQVTAKGSDPSAPEGSDPSAPEGSDPSGSLRRRPRRGGASGGGYVVVHPGASVPARAWAPERNAGLVTALADAGRRVVVTGSPAERALTARVAGEPRPQVTDLGGATDLPGLAGVLAGADAVVVGNTGPAHLAAAVGTPVVSLFAPTVPPVRWRPWGVEHELLFTDVPCAGCRARVCPLDGHPCLSGVTVTDVMAALDRLAPAARPLEAVA